MASVASTRAPARTSPAHAPYCRRGPSEKKNRPAKKTGDFDHWSNDLARPVLRPGPSIKEQKNWPAGGRFFCRPVGRPAGGRKGWPAGGRTAAAGGRFDRWSDGLTGGRMV